MTDITSIIENVDLFWKKKKGLAIVLGLILTGLFSLKGSSILPILVNELIFYPFLLGSCICCLLFWLFNTHRILLPSSKFTVVLMVNFEEEIEKTISTVIQNCIREINKNNWEIRVVLYPYNSYKTRPSIEKYLKRFGCQADLVISLNIISGKIVTQNNLETLKLEINEFIFAGNLNLDNTAHIYQTDVTIRKDLEIQFIHKNWAYIENNSFQDKKKITANLKDIILFCSGLYLIYYQKLPEALEILKYLHNPNLTRLDINSTGYTKISREQFAAGRIYNILLNLYFVTAMDFHFNKKDPHEAYRLLLESNKLSGQHNDSYNHYVALAHLAYTCGELDNARLFTNKMQEIKGDNFDVCLNKGFFAILENNPKELRHWYFKISSMQIPADYNIIQVIGFLEDQKDILPDQTLLLDFAIAVLTKLYVDKIEGTILVENVRLRIIGVNNLSNLSTIISKVNSFRELRFKEKKRTKNKRNKTRKRNNTKQKV